MFKSIKFRDLTADEIDCRIQQEKVMPFDATKMWARVLLYKDARVDQTILDETVGNLNWQRKHEELKENMYCAIGINVNYDDPTKEPIWVFKQDCGAESFSEKEKGEASDSFKRAGVNWGIGRELYTKIPITIFNLPMNKNNHVDGTFEVEKVDIKDKEIVGLSLLFVQKGTKKRCFVWTKEKGVIQSEVKE